MPHRRCALAVVAAGMLFVLPVQAAGGQKKPVEIKCGSEEWKPFAAAVSSYVRANAHDGAKDPFIDLLYRVTAAVFEKCKHEKVAGDAATLPSISGASVAKRKVKYEFQYEGEEDLYQSITFFEKTKAGWTVKRIDSLKFQR